MILSLKIPVTYDSDLHNHISQTPGTIEKPYCYTSRHIFILLYFVVLVVLVPLYCLQEWRHFLLWIQGIRSSIYTNYILLVPSPSYRLSVSPGVEAAAAVEQSNSEDVSRRYPREVLWDPLDPRLLVVQASPLSVEVPDKSHIKKPTPSGLALYLHVLPWHNLTVVNQTGFLVSKMLLTLSQDYCYKVLIHIFKLCLFDRIFFHSSIVYEPTPSGVFRTKSTAEKRPELDDRIVSLFATSDNGVLLHDSFPMEPGFYSQ